MTRIIDAVLLLTIVFLAGWVSLLERRTDDLSEVVECARSGDYVATLSAATRVYNRYCPRVRR